MSARGRARGRWPAIRSAQGSDYSGGMPPYAQQGSNPGYNISPYAGAASNTAQVQTLKKGIAPAK